MKKSILFEAKSKIESSGSFKIFNKIPTNSGAYGLTVEASLDVANLTAGESISISVDGVEVASVNANGVYEFEFKTKPFPLHPETFDLGYSVTNAGTADIVLSLIAH